MHKHALMINNKYNLAAIHGKNRIFKNKMITDEIKGQCTLLSHKI